MNLKILRYFLIQHSLVAFQALLPFAQQGGIPLPHSLHLQILPECLLDARYFIIGLPWWLSGRESACESGDVGSIPVSGRSPGEGNGNPIQHSYLGNSMDRGAWRATHHGIEKGWI